MTHEHLFAEIRQRLRKENRPMRIVDLYPYGPPEHNEPRQALFRLVLGGDPKAFGFIYHSGLQMISLDPAFEAVTELPDTEEIVIDPALLKRWMDFIDPDENR